jgi:hypothetical protein
MVLISDNDLDNTKKLSHENEENKGTYAEPPVTRTFLPLRSYGITDSWSESAHLRGFRGGDREKEQDYLIRDI